MGKDRFSVSAELKRRGSAPASAKGAGRGTGKPGLPNGGSAGQDGQALALAQIGLMKDVVGLFKSIVELGAVRAEWQGRVMIAQQAVYKAEVELLQARERNQLEFHRLDNIVGPALNVVISDFNTLRAEFDPSKLNEDAQRQMRHSMDALVGHMVELVKFSRTAP